MIFDDDADILQLCTLILRSQGFEIYGEINCMDVVGKVKKVNPDVILMDNRIPDLGGVKATQLLKTNAETSRIPVVFFSANQNIELLSQEANAEYFLRKPFDIIALQKIAMQASDSYRSAMID
jgi:two-component system cell cycle response regulator DivK